MPEQSAPTFQIKAPRSYPRVVILLGRCPHLLLPSVGGVLLRAPPHGRSPLGRRGDAASEQGPAEDAVNGAEVPPPAEGEGQAVHTPGQGRGGGGVGLTLEGRGTVELVMAAARYAYQLPEQWVRV